MGAVKAAAAPGAGPCGSIQVTAGAIAIAVSAAQAKRYRPFGSRLRAAHFRAAAYMVTMAAPCQRKWSSVNPRRCTHGCAARI